MSLMHYDHRIDIWEQGAPNTIIWTSYTDETWLTALSEKPPEVKPMGTPPASKLKMR